MPTARDEAAQLLFAYDTKGRWLRLGLEHARATQEDPRDRALLTEIAYGCVRSRGTLDAVLASASSRPIDELTPVVRTALRLALYQVLFLDRVPPHAAVDHAVGWAREQSGEGPSGFVNGVLRNLVRDMEGRAGGHEDLRRDVPRSDGSAIRFRSDVFSDPASAEEANLSERFSMPVWIVETWLRRWGAERCSAILRAGIGRPPLTVRARGDRSKLEFTLKARDISFVEGSVETALQIKDGESALSLIERRGVAAVQDATSQRVVPVLAPQPGERILDLCAAPGGKTLHLADLMGRGRIVACDVDPERVAQIEQLADQVGETGYETVQLEKEAALPFARESFDAVLVDAPCSNTGVLRRRVEARWRLTPDAIEALAAVQSDLLERCVPVLKPGGRIVYSTCSLEPAENEDVMDAFLQKHSSFKGEVAFRAWPAYEADGGFAALLQHEE